MHVLTGHVRGTGAAFVLQLGAIPYHIEFWGLEGAQPDTAIWNRSMIHDTLTCEGIMRPQAGGAVDDYAFGAGLAPYYGGEKLTTTLQTSVTYGAGTYLERDDKDYRFYTNSAAGIVGDAATETITTWTLDTAATPTGHFNGDVTGTYIGEGSLIRIQETASPNRVYECAILALTAGQGVSANEVTLSFAVPSGKVTFIGGMCGVIPTAIGKLTSPGIRFTFAATPNVNGEMMGYMAIMP